MVAQAFSKEASGCRSGTEAKNVVIEMEIKRLSAGDERELEQASVCFDHPIRAAAARRFLKSDTHHILIAYESGQVAGFVSGVETTHPDKGTEMFLYELAVIERFRKRGYGTALVRALADLARERECYGMWVLAERDDAAALKTYQAAGGAPKSTSIMLSWDFRGPRLNF